MEDITKADRFIRNFKLFLDNHEDIMTKYIADQNIKDFKEGYSISYICDELYKLYKDIDPNHKINHTKRMIDMSDKELLTLSNKDALCKWFMYTFHSIIPLLAEEQSDITVLVVLKVLIGAIFNNTDPNDKFYPLITLEDFETIIRELAVHTDKGLLYSLDLVTFNLTDKDFAFIHKYFSVMIKVGLKLRPKYTKSYIKVYNSLTQLWGNRGSLYESRKFITKI